MCGIVGVASVVTRKDRDWLSHACNTLTHRGPDNKGEWWSQDGRVGLAHRRLSILDLSLLGHQPMHFLELGLSVVFNGEIYNYAELRRKLKEFGYCFSSQSDTEILLAAYAHWGMDCIEKLNGMFAFAIFDTKRKKIFMARDRAGEKPIFYYKSNDAIYFASELKALLSNPILPRAVDLSSLDCYLGMGFVPGERCLLSGYQKLAPAHALSYDLENGAFKVWRYWQLPELDDIRKPMDDNLLVNELEILMENAVKRQLVADVPVGILLSGGLDSSLITAIAARQSPSIRTFSIGFHGHGELDETSHAQLIASHFGTNHVQLMAEPDSADLLPILARQFDEPMVDSSMFPTWLLSNLVRKQCSVALGGDGGDELFGGYAHYNQLLQMQKRFSSLPMNLRRFIGVCAEQFIPIGFRGRNYLRKINIDFKKNLILTNFFDPKNRQNLMKSFSSYELVAETIFNLRTPVTSDLLQRATRADFENYLAEDILVKVDRASMSNSLEIRSPFLDYQLIEFAFGKVPSRLKADGKNNKILLKKLAAKILPPEFNMQRKQGFSIPLANWLERGPYRELFWDTLSSESCIFDRETVQNLLKGQDKGRSNAERLFALVQFEIWRKTYNISLIG